MLRPVNCLVLVVLFTLTLSQAQADWLRFRGPNGSGIYTGEQLPPTEWSPEKNLRWKTPLPGPGVASPIVVGDRVFVTCWSGYSDNGTGRESGDINDLKRHLVCLDRRTGDKLWDKSVKAVQPEDPFHGAGVPTHGYASHTPVSDGERVYVFFGKTGALAFDLDGNQLWHTELGKESDPREWGSSSSPILYQNVLIVTASAESEALVGLDTKTGQELWRQEASGLANTWSTPVLADIGEQKHELVIGVPYEIWGLDPATGKFHWYAETRTGDQSNASVITNDEIVYVVQSGRGSGAAAAVKAGGDGDVTDSNVIWSARPSGRFGTPLLYQGRIYNITSRAVTCYDAETGERLYEQRIPAPGRDAADDDEVRNPEGGRRSRFGDRGRGGRGGSDYSSPVIAGGKIYFVTGSGETLVLQPGDTIKLIARNQVTQENENFMAAPAVSDGALFLRSDKHVYCIAAEKPSSDKSTSEAPERE